MRRRVAHRGAHLAMHLAALAVLVVLAALPVAAGPAARAETPAEGTPAEGTPAEEAPLPRPPDAANLAARAMTFTRVTGAPDACGPGCSEWIAAEGVILPGTVVTFSQLVERLGPARPPVVIHSDGGMTDIAMALGRVIRRARLDTVIARTARSDGTATIEPGGACHGACLFVLAAGVARSTAPGAVISISPFDFHFATGGALPEPRRQRLIVAMLERARGYFTDMGLDPDLASLLDSNTHTAFYPTRGQLEAYRILTRYQDL